MAGAFAIAMAGMVWVATSRDPNVPTYVPSEIAPRYFGDTLVGPLTYTVDARAPEEWTFFDFSSGSTVRQPADCWGETCPAPTGWDLGFKRHAMIVNGGDGFHGAAGIQRLDSIPFAALMVAPGDGYVTTEVRSDSTLPGDLKWYDYNWTNHVLSPKPGVYAVRTADGAYAKFEILSYYCEGVVGGCWALRYTYQGSGSRKF